MAPLEFHRYIDGRGDTIIYKFDPELAHNPDPKWPNDSPVTVYQHYVITKLTGTVLYHSDLLPLELAIDRSRTDKSVSQPPIGKVMYTENTHLEDGEKLRTQYIWKGWSHEEGYRKGWAKLCVRALPTTDLSTKPPLRWRL
jgi:hypothetical protein